MSSSDEGASENLDLFNEPEGFFQEKKEPTTIVHKTLNGEQLSLRLVGYSPLWVGARGSVEVHFLYCTESTFIALKTFTKQIYLRSCHITSAFAVSQLS